MPILGSDYYKPGDVIYQGEPFVRVMKHDLWQKICANCFKISASLKNCGACRMMKYCGHSCQKKTWPNHKLECPFLRNCKKNERQPIVQMIGNVILKIEGRDWKTITEKLEDRVVSFDDLVSHTGTKIDPRNFPDIKSIKDDVESYIGKEKMPTEENLYEIIGKVFYNSFQRDYTDGTVSEYRTFFISVSKLDHSCVPNSTLVFFDHSLTLRASKEFPKSEEITIAYGPLITRVDAGLLAKMMQRGFLEKCYCSDCSQPFGKSALTNIIDEGKAFSVIEETSGILLLISLLAKFKYPIGIVTREKLDQLLRKQEGVLGRTNLLRMQTLTIKALFQVGPVEKMKRELVELANVMKEVWGEYFEELLPVYKKLLDISVTQVNFEETEFYSRKIADMFNLYFGFDLKTDVTTGEFDLLMKAFSQFGNLMER